MTSLMLLVIISTAMLLALSVRGRASVEERDGANEHIRTAQAMRVALLHYARDSDLAYATKLAGDQRKRLDSEASVMVSLAQARGVPTSDEQRRHLTDAEEKIKTYFLARRDAEARGLSTREVLLASSPPLNDALAAAQRVVDFSAQHVTRVDAAARSRIRERESIESIVGAIFLIGFLGALVGLRRWVIQPLLCLGEAIRRFAGGDKLSRVEEHGPAEFQATAHMFNQMADHMVRQEEQRLTFLAGVSHDLRNPLAALRGSTHLLRPGVPLPSEEKVRKTMALVDRQVTRMERMVADLLDASRIESGHLELRLARHDVRPLAEEAVQLYAASSHSHELTLQSLADPLTINCDATRIEQVLNNLISNAIKYSPAGGPIRVTLSRDDGFATLEVADRGIGIASDELESVFTPFRRTGASRETIPGVGLGLWVSRRIVEAHGGSLEVSSELGAGSTFRIRLPLVAPAGAVATEGQHSTGLH
jgi:signal transduction histidine kinase